MKKIFTYIAILALTSCTIIDYEREMRTFDDYMRGVVMRYGFDTAEAFNDMLEADHDLFGIGEGSSYTMLEPDVWQTQNIDTLWTGGHSLSAEGTTWTFSKNPYSNPDRYVYTLTRTSTGWEGRFVQTLGGYWEENPKKFSCTGEIIIEENNGDHIFHIKGERMEEEFSSRFGTTPEGMCNNSGSFTVETFINGEPAHSGTIEFTDGRNWLSH